MEEPVPSIHQTRTLLLGVLFGAFLSLNTRAQQDKAITLDLQQNQVLYDSIVEGIHIAPGRWRPLFETEHIAWVSPPWDSTEYIWLDFPEAIFVDGKMLFLSHVNPPFPSKHNELGLIPWERVTRGIQYSRQLPGNIRFGGRVTQSDSASVDLTIWIENGTSEPLRSIRLQTCAFLNSIGEFDKETDANKMVHVPTKGWVPLNQAANSPEDGQYRVGWLDGPKVADLAVVVTKSSHADRMVAMTWFESTYSFIGNHEHPCFHADPYFEDIAPGETGTIKGRLIFFEGSISEFEKYFRSKDR